MANQFRTEVPPISYPFQLTHQHAVLCYGSCFAEHMAGRLQERKFKTQLNPFGITYHPLQIATGISKLLSSRTMVGTDVFQHNGIWQSFAFHSQFSHPDKEQALRQMNHSLQESTHFLQQVDLLIVTLGTAYGFIEQERGRLVNNCHKLPAKLFKRKRFQPEEMIQPLAKAFQALREQRPKLRVLLTVSPVRHIKDGMVENQRSKAALLLTAADLEKRLDFVHYFPAYELVIDDLRDYRFFATDMVHPNQLAVDYIWSYFQHSLFDQPTQQLNAKIEKIKQASEHRPFHPNTEGHQAFLQKQIAKIQHLQKQYPDLDFSKEQQIFENHLSII
ncbi:MAG: GSCFA domain-containing protein [Saprospiraceae bacterium]|nr:GSCFA domain-containing protein [Saprospiraceae bacterium]